MYKIGREQRYSNKLWFCLDENAEGPQANDDIEILYILQGRAGVFTSDNNYLLKQEDMSLFNPMERHEFLTEPGTHFLIAHIEAAFIGEYHLGWLNMVSCLQKEKSNHLNYIREKLGTICKYLIDGSYQKLFIQRELIDLLSILDSEFTERRTSADVTASVSAKENLLSNVIPYLYAHYQEDCTLQTVAKTFYISSGWLSRIFMEQIGISYSDYVDRIRLLHAKTLLTYTDNSVIQVGEACGYHNVNTFINHFHAAFGVTPGKYRQSGAHGTLSSGHIVSKPTENINETKLKIALLPLLKYSVQAQNEIQASAAKKTICQGTIHLKGNAGQRRHNPCKTLLMGYATGYFSPYFKKTAELMSRSMRYEYFMLTGIFEDMIGICQRNSAGKIEMRYNIIDNITDYILSLGLLPFYELDATPGALVQQSDLHFLSGYMCLPDHNEEWCFVIEALLQHFIDRYGFECVSKWRFSLLSPILSTYGSFTRDEYRIYYRETIHSIRKILPDVTIVSGSFDADLLRLEEDTDSNLLSNFLRNAREDHVLPDEIGIQIFQVIYQKDNLQDTLDRIRKPVREAADPATPSNNENQMAEDIDLIYRYMAAADVDLPVCIVAWNSSLWYSDLVADTCFKSAFYMKNLMENEDRISLLCVPTFYEDEANGDLFSGGPGMVTAYGIPKSVVHTAILADRLEETLYAAGNGWRLFGNQEKTHLELVLWHYEHYNLDLRLDHVLPLKEQRLIDRYISLQSHGEMETDITITGLKPGKWKRTDIYINREYGSSYDVWRHMGAPISLSEDLQNYMIRMSAPGISLMTFSVAEGDSLHLSEILGSEAVECISLEWCSSVSNI